MIGGKSLNGIASEDNLTPELAIKENAATAHGIKYYSGTAVYTKKFDLSAGLRGGGKEICLDLGVVRDLAEVVLNNDTLGVVWCEPYQVEITNSVRDTGNVVKIAVVNQWSNRLPHRLNASQEAA